MKHFKILVLVSLVLFLSIPSFAEEIQNKRPETWAQPIEIEGLPNLHKVSDTLYRAAQPKKEGIAQLKALNIKTVVSLRSYHSDENLLKGSGCGYVPIPMKTWQPEEEDVIRFLKIVSDPAKTPVLVHCQHGADRTGTFCALYRIVVQDWTKEEAIREMIEGGYGYHSVWTNLPPWIKSLDIEQIRKKAGLSKHVLASGRKNDLTKN